MTYQNVLQWAIDHLPVFDYENFREWYDAITSEFQTPNLTDSNRFREMAEEAWDKSGRNEEPEEEPIQQPRSNIVKAGTPEIKEKPKRFIPRQQQEENRQLPPTGKAPVITPFRFFGE